MRTDMLRRLEVKSLKYFVKWYNKHKKMREIVFLPQIVRTKLKSLKQQDEKKI